MKRRQKQDSNTGRQQQGKTIIRKDINKTNKTKQGCTILDKTRHKTRQGCTILDKKRQDKMYRGCPCVGGGVERDKTRDDKSREDKSRRQKNKNRQEEREDKTRVRVRTSAFVGSFLITYTQEYNK
jgi:hypothetical protein